MSHLCPSAFPVALGPVTLWVQPLVEDEQKHFHQSPANETHPHAPTGVQLMGPEEPGLSSRTRGHVQDLLLHSWVPLGILLAVQFFQRSGGGLLGRSRRLSVRTHREPQAQGTPEAQEVGAVSWPHFSPPFEFFAGSLGFRLKMKSMSTKQDGTKSFPSMPQHAALPSRGAQQ